MGKGRSRLTQKTIPSNFHCCIVARRTPLTMVYGLLGLAETSGVDDVKSFNDTHRTWCARGSEFEFERSVGNDRRRRPFDRPRSFLSPGVDCIK